MKKILIMTALLAGLVAASYAAVTAVSVPGTNTFNDGEYEIFLGPADLAGFGQTIDNTYRGQTITTSNAFDLGSISILYDTDGLPVSNMVVHVYPVDDPLALDGFVFPPASTLFSASFDAPPAANDVDNTLILDLGTNISLAADSGYMILLDSTSASATTFRWYRSGAEGGDFYADGAYIRNDGTADARDLLIGLGLQLPLTANDDVYPLESMVTSINVAAPGVLLNDIKGESVVLVTDISSGSLTLNADGSFECSGLSNGDNTFTYAAVSGSETSTPATVSVIVTLTEDPPIVVDDTYVMDAAYGNHIEGNVLNNDTNISVLFDMLAMADDTNTIVNGTLTWATNGSGDFYYIADPGFSGTETFTYKAYTPLATSVVATVTLNVESNYPGGVVIDAFENYDNTLDSDVPDIPEADFYWDANGSGMIEINDAGGYGPNYQWLEFGWSGGRYRGAVSRNGIFSGIPNSSTEYWLYFEMYIESPNGDGLVGVTVNPANSTATSYRGDFNAGVRMTSDGSGVTLDLYAVTGGGASNDVLLATGVNEDEWYGVWMNINNASNTFDVYFGDAGDATSPGTLVGSDISFNNGGADLVALLVSGISDTRVDNIIHLDPDSFFDNLPANLYGNSLAAFDTMQLTIGLNDRARAADYWPVSSDSLVVSNWAHVAHSDAPDGIFAVTNLSLASGDETNKVIYVKTTDSVEFFRINNQ